MAKITFAQYAPDISELDTNVSSNIINVIPRADGYGPVEDLEGFTSALPSACRGSFFARAADGTIIEFAGTETDLYRLDNTTFDWTNVSYSGQYSSVPTNDHWQFAQFNNLILAVQQNVVPQVYDITSSSTFSNLGGGPPQAGCVAIVNRFVVLSRLLGNATRVHWSDLNNTTQWTAGVGQCDFQDLPDGGRVGGVAGGDYFGVIMQDASIRTMTYAPGSPVIFDIKRVSKEDGLFFTYGYTTATDRVFLISSQGFKMLQPGASGPTPVGKERVDRTFRDDIDQSEPRLCIAASDPSATRVYWAYKSITGQTGLFDKILCYDWFLDKWTTLSISGEYLTSLARPGITLEGLDAIAPGHQTITGVTSSGASNNIRLTVSVGHGYSTGEIKAISGVLGTSANGNWTITLVGTTGLDLDNSTYTNAWISGGIVGGNIDLLPFSLDAVQISSPASLSAFTSGHRLGFFTGDALEATVETPEQNAEGKRMFISGVRPITDAPDCAVSLGVRNNAQSSVIYTAETIVNSVGICPQRVDTRYARARLRIPAATAWNNVQSIEPKFILTGDR